MITRSPVKPVRPPSGVLPKRAPTPLRSTPTATATTSILTSSTATGSTATPHEAMVASQQAHINELVQKNRSLEQSMKKLNEELAKSVADILALNSERKSWERDRETWVGERQKWVDERKAWVEGCERMQACHRIQEYRLACSLQDERVAVLRMQEEARKEQVKRLLSDYNGTMLKAQLAEARELSDNLVERVEQLIEANSEDKRAVQELEKRFMALQKEVEAKTAEARTAQQQREQVENDLRRLREAHADATASTSASSSKIDRLTKERDSLEAQVASLKRSLEHAQDEAGKARTQLTNWQNLKKGEDADAEEARKKKGELEQELTETKKRVAELETRVGDLDSLEAKLEKQKGRVEKLKSVLEEWKVEAREQTSGRQTAEAELGAARAQIINLEQKITELQAQLSAHSKSKPPSNKHIVSPRREQSDEESDGEIYLSPSKSSLPRKDKPKQASTSKPSSSRPEDAAAKPRPKPRPVKRPDPIPESQDSDIEIVQPPSVPPPVHERSNKAKGKQKALQDVEDVSDIEMGEVRKEKKTKPKDKEKGDSEEPTRAKAVKRKKPSPSDDVEPERSKPKAKPNPKKRPSPDPPKKSKPSQAKDALEDTAEEMDTAPKKKKRKINLFGGSQPATFDWNALGQTGQGLGIPTELSPMKETDVAPRRLGRSSKG